MADRLVAGRFELLDVVGSGAFGLVWRAYDWKHRKLVAVKIFASRGSEPELVHRFVQEQGFRLSHPNVIAPLDFFSDSQQAALVMDLAEGGSLEELLGGGRPTLSAAVAMLAQLLEGLAYVHDQGIVHRDIKPANVLLDADNAGRMRVRLSDFGHALPTGGPRLTGPTNVVGTPGYIAPELYGFDDASPRSDLYSVGAVAYQLLTGNQPAAPLDAFAAIDPAVPEALRDWIVTLTQPEPAHRPRSAQAALETLQTASSSFRTVTPTGQSRLAKCPRPTYRRRRHRRRLIAAAGAVVLASAIATEVVTSGARVRRATQQARQERARNVEVARNEKRSVQQQALLTDSQRLAALAVQRAPKTLGIALLLAVEGHRLHESTTTSNAMLSALVESPHLAGMSAGLGGEITSANFNPDRTRVAVGTTDGSLRVWDLTTSKPLTPRITAHRGEITDVAYSADGRMVATAGSDETARIWDATTLRPVGPPLKVAGDRAGGLGRSVSFSPDGRTVATLGYPVGSMVRATEGLRVGSKVQFWSVPSGKAAGISVEGLGSQALTNSFSHSFSTIAFSPDGTSLAYGHDLIDLANHGQVTSLPTGDVFGNPSFSADGSKLALTKTDGAVVVFDTRTRRRFGHVLAFRAGAAVLSTGRVALSPDGLTLASDVGDGRILRWDVATGSQLGEPLVGLDSDVLRIAFSADGKRILGASATGTATWRPDDNVFATPVQAKGTRDPIRLTLAISEDGALVATLDSNGVGTVNLTEPVHQVELFPRIPGDSVTAARFDASGSRLAIADDASVTVWDVSHRSKVAELKLSGTALLAGSLRFSPDGRNLAVLERDDYARDAESDVLVFEVANHRRIRTLRTVGERAGNITSVAYSPDGRRLAMADHLGDVGILDLATGRERVGSAVPQPTPIDDLTFSADGSRLVSIDNAGVIALRDPVSGRVVGTPLNFGMKRPPDNDGAFVTTDGSLLAVLDIAGLLTFWDTDIDQQVGIAVPAAPESAPHSAVGLASLPRTHLLVTEMAGEELLWFWDMRPESWARKACQLAGRNFTRAEWQLFVRDRPYQRTCSQWPAGA